MQAYLDNSATTRPFDDVRELISSIEENTYGNPSSMHMMGIDAEKELRTAKENFASLLKVKEKEILFTSGGTESDNMALIGCARANCRAGKHLITTKIEHPAILEAMKYLEEEGFLVTYLGVDKSGRVEPSELKEALTDDTILVSIMQVNNEIGSIQRIAELSSIVKSFKSSILFHVDAVQSFGKLRIYPKKMGIDLLSISSHKIHGPKGVGVLYIDEHVKIKPIIFGGGQQKGMRSGTENVPAIAGFARAAVEIYEDHDAKTERLYDFKAYIINELSSLEGVIINGIPEDDRELNERIRETAPHIISVSIKGIRAEVMLHALEDRGIYVSSGSACASNKPAISATLKAIGVNKDLLDSTVRISLSVLTTKEELEYTVAAVKEIVPTLRKYMRH